jgi:hypothetical protein
MAAFHLSKWYLDCVTDSGDTSIVYTGTVNWGPSRVHYSSLLEHTAGSVTSRHSLRAQTEPIIDHCSLRWQSEALKIDGEWKADSVEIRETIFSSDAGSIEWHCLMPRAQVRIHDSCGLGYAEHINMAIAPWKLPIRTLRWGRFAADSEWIVWIDWLGDFTRRLVYWNGHMAATSLLEDGEIAFCDGSRLLMDRSLVLREGPLGSTVLSAVPGLRDTFPARLLRVNECKWRSRARLERPGASPVEAWAIHERVDWPA